MSTRIINGDCLVELRSIVDCSIDSCVTDPPYHLTTGKKGGSGPASLNENSAAGRARIGTGFMGMKWDGGDVAMRPEVWAEVLRVLKPGAYLLAFGGTRTYHRMACAIEDAGFEIRDQIGWAFGSGFPKSRNGNWGGTALKPAWEPIAMARKPPIGTVEENFTRFGTGGLDIDGCRVEVGDDSYARNCSGDRGHEGTRSNDERGATDMKMGGGRAAAGRWPANLIHDGSDEVLACFPDNAGAAAPVHKRNGDKFRNTFGGNIDEAGSTFQGDSGSAARFFYCPKATRKDRNAGSVENNHPTVKPTELMRYLCRLVTPKGGTVLDPFMGSGSTGRGALREGLSFIGIELDQEYCEVARVRIDADAPLFAGAP